MADTDGADDVLGGRSVTRAIIDDVTCFNAQELDQPVGAIGIVLGATLDLRSYGIDLETAPAPALPVLAPGFGHQGAAVADARRIYGALAPTTIVSESRSMLVAGPRSIADAVAGRAKEVRDALG